MQESLNHENEMEKLRVENELKKMKLTMETGANFFSSPESDLPPEVEGKWLDHVQKFEDAYKDCKQVSVYEFIGKPDFRNVQDIPSAEINIELKRVLDILRENSIVLDTICEVEDIVLYRFITEELFQLETDDIRIEGMNHCYIYEEFHPNHEYDIKKYCVDFIEILLDKERGLNPMGLGMTDTFQTEIDGIITEAEAIKRMELFQGAFREFTLENFIITSVNIQEDKALVTCEIKYSAVEAGSNKTRIFEGQGYFGLIYQYEFWYICQANIPGGPF